MARAHWLVKSEPFKYPFDKLVREGRTRWDGVRSFEARNNLRAMKKGDLCLFYHSSEGKEVVGVARVSVEAYEDPTTEEDFSAVDLEPVRALRRAVGLAELRAHPVLGEMMMFRRPRLSVVPVTPEEYETVLALASRPPAPATDPSAVATSPSSRRKSAPLARPRSGRRS